MSERWLQISAGQGPIECAWAVMRVLRELGEEARADGLAVRLLELESGARDGTANSVLISLTGEGAATFLARWVGTVQWIATSPFRPHHKRKNWFVTVNELAQVEAAHFDAKEIRWETMRASGPGGQHVNRTESAVRVTHLPTGVQAVAADESSQHRNRKLALARLARRLEERQAELQSESRRQRWRTHLELQRGNPVRVFRA